jgi:hypothetical protein
MSAQVIAAPVTCGGDDRIATLNSAEECSIGSGNTNGNGTEINSYFNDLAPWTQEGESTDNGSNGLFSVELTSGQWGNSPIEGNWTISSDFWLSYGSAVISMHVGNGGGDPDHWAWLITSGETSGTFSYQKLQGNGGGLSNLMLWGAGTPTLVSEPSGFAIMVLGIIALGFNRRKFLTVG